MRAQFVTANEVAEIMGISRSKAYQIVREMNKELKSMGYITVAGKCPVQFFKQNSIVGKLLRPLTWAFSELLLDFRLTGPLDDPKWSYENIVKKMMEVGK